MRNIYFILIIFGFYSCSKEAKPIHNETKTPFVYKVEKLASNFSFVEGPAADSLGNIYFSDIPNQKIYIWNTNDSLVLYRENSGGANGLIFDKNQNLIACEGYRGRLSSTTPQGAYNILVNTYNGKAFNQPNDIWIDDKNGFYFTDPFYGDNDNNIPQDGMHVYYFNNTSKSIMRVCDDFVKPNGIVGTEDGKNLYISDQADGKIYRFNVLSNGFLWNKTLFINKGSDGMAIDNQGNLYISPNEEKKVEIYSPKGELINAINIPEYPSNVTFAGKNAQHLYITARTSLYRVKLQPDTKKSI